LKNEGKLNIKGNTEMKKYKNSKRTQFPHFLSTIDYELSTVFEKQSQFDFAGSWWLAAGSYFAKRTQFTISKQ
jgi:hypothetical protein